MPCSAVPLTSISWEIEYINFLLKIEQYNAQTLVGIPAALWITISGSRTHSL
ncbi:MAG: hypothetical protein ACTSO4_14695 [Promethearchaeota archaeon]